MKVYGRLFLTNCQIGFFDDKRTIGLQFSTDGVQLFQGIKKEVWPFLILNLNLPPQERYPIFRPLLMPDTKSRICCLLGYHLVQKQKNTILIHTLFLSSKNSSGSRKAYQLMTRTQTRISVLRPSFAWLPETLLRYRSYSNYQATPQLIPVEPARSAARHTSIDILQRPERTKARPARIHAVIIRFHRPSNSPPRYPLTKEKGYLGSLPTRIMTISPYALMTVTSMTAKQV